MKSESRRTFLKQTAATTTLLATASFSALAAERTLADASRKLQWYRRTLRWGQTNITEHDPAQYDIAWWRGHWKRTRVQGVIINAGGIVAYYPSRFALHHRAEFLGDRDLFGELCRAAHEDGLAVFARMDSNRAHEPLYQAHPDWFAVDAEGNPYKAGALFTACINSPYYEEWIPDIMREIVERYRPEGFTDNSWSGLGRGSICYCNYCRQRFHAHTGEDLPRQKNWENPVYRAWIQWGYARRVEIWDFNNGITRAAGGPDCIWVGMNSGSVTGQCQSLRDYKAICERAEIIMLDHQSRGDASGFQHNGEAGKLIHGLLGWNKLIPESMAMYQAGNPTFRLASKPEPEARLWMLDGFAGGIQPWWHHIGANQEDRRMLHTAEPVMRWHEANEQFLVNREPIANIGLVWSQTNIDFHGRDDAELLTELPWRGWTNALVRARIPYLPVHIDHLERDAAGLTVLILPNLAALSDAQAVVIRRFVERGGNLIATGETSLSNEWGDRRTDFALSELFGAHVKENHAATDNTNRRRWASETQHTYLRLTPPLKELKHGSNLHEGEQRHPVLRGFEETDILPFGGMLAPLRLDSRALVPLTFVPPFPVYPPETAWMREPLTEIPGLILSTTSKGARVAYLPADLDRRFARDNLPDHGDLLANLVRWTAHDNLPLTVEGVGYLDCHLYRQPGRVLLHIVNLTSAGTWRQPVDEIIPVGPVRIKLRLPDDVRSTKTRLLVADQWASSSSRSGWATFEIKSIHDHELVLIGRGT